MNAREQYRQGDVLIERVAEIPGAAKKREQSRRIILAEGEATGHCHVMETIDPADWWKQDEIPAATELPDELDDGLYLSLTANATVTHEEHAPIELPPGKYRVTHQREYSPRANRRVAD